MSAATQTAQHGLSEHSHGAGVPIQTRYERKRSTNVQDFPAISAREEQWRYLSADRLGGLDADTLSEFTGDLAITHSDGVTTAWVGEENPAFGGAGIPEERPSAAAWGSAKQAYLVTVPANQKSDVQIALSSDSAEPSALHLIIDAKPFAEATVILDHKGHAILGENVEIIVGDEAQLTVVSIQDWDDHSIHASTQMARLGRNSRLKHVVVSLGGKTVRVASSTEFTQPGGDTEMLGMYFADAGQYLENRLYVDHAVPNCKSRVTYKGALQGEKAHTVWVGDVLIRMAAEGTDTYELNRNLLLTDGARADSVPNLEIETGKIEGAGHASASGRFDDEQLFYLQARGITEIEARRLVVRGFLNEIIQQIDNEQIRERLTKSIEAELERSGS
ncbi:Fe-S cluster assembly protein SufD [Rhodoluna lacicola]|jgi:Fe-S cluster assembly protein SufD|uniref:FeS assembly protein SufD n=1 Tax=Rhodoluna lacicola TaxID=529884 RepID=A0A060JFU3_9MICO|nr:Fe-S cluster assembly protein SufD [Rhodoluna lacicola]AIC47595.1 FeS assembly protein SufD [Rhodoluna lacicola]